MGGGVEHFLKGKGSLVFKSGRKGAENFVAFFLLHTY